jgi:hypothetical protein
MGSRRIDPSFLGLGISWRPASRPCRFTPSTTGCDIGWAPEPVACLYTDCVTATFFYRSSKYLNAVFWVMTPCSPVGGYHVWEEHTTYILRRPQHDETDARSHLLSSRLQSIPSTYLIHTNLLRNIYDPAYLDSFLQRCL